MIRHNTRIFVKIFNTEQNDKKTKLLINNIKHGSFRFTKNKMKKKIKQKIAKMTKLTLKIAG